MHLPPEFFIWWELFQIIVYQGTFGDLVSDPYLADQFKKNVTYPGYGYGKLNVLAPGETVKFKGLISPGTNDKAVAIPYVFSDEQLGKVFSMWTVVFYALLGVCYSLLFLGLYRSGITAFTRGDMIASMLAIVIYVSIFIALYHVVAIIPTYPNSSPAWPA